MALSAKMAPPCSPLLLLILLVPLKISELSSVQIAPPVLPKPFAELLLKLLVPVKSNTVYVLLTPQKSVEDDNAGNVAITPPVTCRVIVKNTSSSEIH